VSEEFAGETTLIVCGSSGIGKAVGRILLERGAEIHTDGRDRR
jgi:NAD(P)-dependent dehydrogenase (short-subunit alcohol dehydrogenase family)